MALIFGCTKNEIKVIDIKEVFSDLNGGQISINQLEFDLSDCLYLDSSLKYLIDSLEPSYFRDRAFDLSKYVFDPNDKEEIWLSSNYESVKDLIVSSDRNLKRYLKNRFGVKDYKEDITEAVLVYEEKAFIKFSNEFSSSGYLVELIEPNKINLLIAYVIVD